VNLRGPLQSGSSGLAEAIYQAALSVSQDLIGCRRRNRERQDDCPTWKANKIHLKTATLEFFDLTNHVTAVPEAAAPAGS
jgi:hypothetical protein